MSDSKNIPIKPYTPKEIRQLYGVSRHVFNTWKKKIEDKLGEIEAGVYTPTQVKIMFDHFGPPETE